MNPARRSRRSLIRSWALRAFSCVAVCGCLSPAAAGAHALPSAGPDSSSAFSWSALYRSRLAISRGSGALRWSDPAALAHVNDRLAVLAQYRAGVRWDVFVKGATGSRFEGEEREARFALAEGHARARLLGGALEGRLFSRERIFRTDSRLLEVLSNDASFIDARGEGCLLALTEGPLRARYIESFLRNPAEVEAASGLPLLRGGGDTYRLLSFELRSAPRAHVGGLLSQTLTTAGEDAVMIGSGAGLRFLGIDCYAELARSSPGRWDDLAGRSLFDLRLGDATVDRPSALLSPYNAFAAEASFVSARSPWLGVAGAAGGYRFRGASFMNAEGELDARLSETYLTAWWKHPLYDVSVDVEATRGDREGSAEYRRLVASARARFRGAFELREGILCSSGDRSSAFVTLIDENRLSRMLVTARLDGLGEDNALSFDAEGGMNLGRSVTLGGALFVYRGAESLYHVDLEFRPRDRFLLRVAFGSFTPADEGIALARRFDAVPPAGERAITLLARIWFGSD